MYKVTKKFNPTTIIINKDDIIDYDGMYLFIVKDCLDEITEINKEFYNTSIYDETRKYKSRKYNVNRTVYKIKYYEFDDPITKCTKYRKKITPDNINLLIGVSIGISKAHENRTYLYIADMHKKPNEYCFYCKGIDFSSEQQLEEFHYDSDELEESHYNSDEPEESHYNSDDIDKIQKFFYSMKENKKVKLLTNYIETTNIIKELETKLNKMKNKIGSIKIDDYINDVKLDTDFTLNIKLKKFECNICYEKTDQYIYCQKCKEKLCITCLKNLDYKKCPFCRGMLI